jgi:5-hydroxyisourate hydrolase-like protein (transthyretin family)
MLVGDSQLWFPEYVRPAAVKNGDICLMVHRLAVHLCTFACCLFFSTVLFAAQLTGTVTNATTGKPAAGDEVTLLSLTGGMQETSSATTDALGKFTFEEPDESVEHLIRVNHDGAFYFKAAPVGTRTSDVNVYDVAAKVDNILQQGRVFQMQTGNGQLEVSEKYILRNQSAPPRTRMGDHSFEIELPPGAQLVDSMAAGPGGMPVTVMPVPLKGRKNHYGLPYPLRPGETQFRINYKIPYSGRFDFTVNPDTPVVELGVILPKSMKLMADGFAQDNDEAGMSVFFMKNVAAAQAVKFSVSGEGVAPREAQEPPAPDANSGAAPSTETAAGNGKSSWYLVGLLFGVLLGGAVIVFRKRRVSFGDRSGDGAEKRTNQKISPAKAGQNGSMLDALKEELFQLETDRLDGRISQQDYEKSKAGLDTLIRRQMDKTAAARRS